MNEYLENSNIVFIPNRNIKLNPLKRSHNLKLIENDAITLNKNSYQSKKIILHKINLGIYTNNSISLKRKSKTKQNISSCFKESRFSKEQLFSFINQFNFLRKENIKKELLIDCSIFLNSILKIKRIQQNIRRYLYCKSSFICLLQRSKNKLNLIQRKIRLFLKKTFNRKIEDIIKIQSIIRQYHIRKIYIKRLNEIENKIKKEKLLKEINNTKKVIEIQSKSVLIIEK